MYERPDPAIFFKGKVWIKQALKFPESAGEPGAFRALA